MPKLLTRLRIDEVSAVDAGAGHGVKIMLMKRDQDVIAKAVAALEESVNLICSSDGDDATKRDELVETFTQFQTFLNRKVAGDKAAVSKGPLERETRRVRKEFEEIFKVDGDDGGDGDDGDPVAAVDHHVSRVADLLVEAKSHPDRAAALQHLLHTPSGQALLSRLNKKDSPPMDLHQEMISIMKSQDPVSFCKAVVDREYSPVSDAELVKLTTAHAQTVFPGLAPDVAFARLYETNPIVREACQVAHATQINKAAGAAFDVAIVNPGSETVEAVDDTSQSEAYKQLVSLAEKLHAAATTGGMTKEMAFARVVEDPQNKALADKALRPPSPTSVFPFPRADRTRSSPGRQGDGAYRPTKSDHGSSNEPTAYGELLAKAEEYRAAHPELSIAQAFEKVFTASANRELAKRERVESAPR
jgi:hypothetical protein